MPPGTVGTLAFCRVPWKPWAADTAFPSLRRVRRPKRCLIHPFDPSIWPFPHSDTLPVLMTHPPRQSSGSRSRSQSADQPQDLLEPVPSAPRHTTLAPIFTSLSRRLVRDHSVIASGNAREPTKASTFVLLSTVTPKSGALAFYPGTQCPARPIPGIARRNSNVRRWAGPLL
jgi:hypothetical protein